MLLAGFRASEYSDPCNLAAPDQFERDRCVFKMSTELVTLQHFRDVPEALLAKGKLESAGIACALADGQPGSHGLAVRQTPSAAFACRCTSRTPLRLAPFWTSPSRPSSAKKRSASPDAQPRCPRCYSLDIGSKELIASGPMVSGSFYPFPFPSARTTGSATPAASNGSRNEETQVRIGS